MLLGKMSVYVICGGVWVIIEAMLFAQWVSKCGMAVWNMCCKLMLIVCVLWFLKWARLFVWYIQIIIPLFIWAIFVSSVHFCLGGVYDWCGDIFCMWRMNDFFLGSICIGCGSCWLRYICVDIIYHQNWASCWRIGVMPGYLYVLLVFSSVFFCVSIIISSLASDLLNL